MAAEPRSGNELAQLLMEKAAGDEKIRSRQPEAVPDRSEMRALVERTKTWADAQLITAPDPEEDHEAGNGE